MRKKLLMFLVIVVTSSAILAQNLDKGLKLVISAPSEAADHGSLQITATIINESGHDVTIQEINGDPSFAYLITVRELDHLRILPIQSNPVGDDPPAIFSVSPHVLKTGDRYQETIDIGTKCDLSHTGSYSIVVERYVPAGLTPNILVSNELKITVR